MGRLPSFAQRTAPHTLPERMDGAMDFATFEAYLASLAGVNVLSLGYRPTLRFADRLLARAPAGRPLHVVDVGSGYGDTVRVLADHFFARGVTVHLTGLDRNPDAARSAQRHPWRPRPPVTVEWLTAEAADLAALAERPDAIVSSLLAHHLEDGELVAFLREMDRTARLGWFVNDLSRSRFAATAFPVLARLARRHPNVAHDGPISFARAFRPADWRRLLGEAGIAGARLSRPAPFRLCVEKFSAAP